MPLKFAVLGSGSSGNCAVISCADTTLLVDAGLSASQIRSRLAHLNVAPESISGIVLTHEHGDHTRGLDVLCRKLDIPVFCNAQTKAVVSENVRHPIKWRVVQTGNSFAIGGIKIETFPVPHDAVEPMGLTFRREHSSLGFISDVGHITHLMKSRLEGVHALFIEANYDMELLVNDLKRPWSTKQRIMSQHGHLSNDQTAGLVADLAHDGLERIVLGHLSQDCNKPQRAIQAVAQAVVQKGFPQIEVHCAGPEAPTSWFLARQRVEPVAAPSHFSTPPALIPAGPMGQMELF